MSETMSNVGPGTEWTSTPRPDPTVLTQVVVDQAKADIRREMGSLRELIEARVAALEGVCGALGNTVAGMPGAADHIGLKEQLDTQIAALRELFEQDSGSARSRTDTAREGLHKDLTLQVSALRELHEERFAAIQQQFDERDVRGEQEKKASKEALDAALLAQKESVSQQNDANTTAATKSETSFTKQIDQIGTLIATLEKSLTDRITELKERIDRGEGTVTGGSATRAGIVTLVYAMAATVAAVAAVIALAIHG